jgi:hypothetical protein
VVANPISGFEPVDFRKREQHLSQLFDYPLVTAGEIEQKIWRFDRIPSVTNRLVHPIDTLVARPAAILVRTLFKMSADLFDAMRGIYAVNPPALRIPRELEGGTKVFLPVKVADPPAEGVEICQVVHRVTPPFGVERCHVGPPHSHNTADSLEIP